MNQITDKQFAQMQIDRRVRAAIEAIRKDDTAEIAICRGSRVGVTRNFGPWKYFDGASLVDALENAVKGMKSK